MDENKTPIDEIPEETEEITVEEQEILKEQDALDGDATEVDDAEDVEQTLADTLAEAVASHEITEEEAEEISNEVLTELDTELPKKSGKGTLIGVCAAAAAVVVLTAVLLFMWFSGGEKQWNGLEAGKSYDKYIELADYSALTYTDTYKEPTEADIDEQIKVDMAGTDFEHKNEVTDGIQNGDVAKLDFEGYIDGEKYDQACAEDFDLTIGSNQFIPGFESGLVGHKAGEKVTLNLTFPDPYETNTALSGKAVRFEVTVKTVTRTTYDELTDAVADKLSDGAQKTVAEYRENTKSTLDAAAQNQATEAIKNELWQKIVESSTLKKYPQEMYDYFVSKLDETYSAYYSQYGATDLEGFMKAINTDLKTYVSDQLKYEFAIYTIANEQEIEITQEDIDTLVKQYNYESLDKLLEEQKMARWELDEYILYTKVTAYLVASATVAQ